MAGAARIRARIHHFFGKQWPRSLLLGGIRSPHSRLQGQLIWDDDYLTRDNPFIKSPLFVLEAFRHDFSRTLTQLITGRSKISLHVRLPDLEWQLGFHLSSVLFHVVAGVLLYLLLRHLVSGNHVRPGR